MGGSAVIRTLFGFVNPYGILDDPLLGSIIVFNIDMIQYILDFISDYAENGQYNAGI